MTPEAQRVKIAEACGWKQVIEELFNIQQMSWMRPGDKENHGFRPPDYLNDLNAMHEAVQQEFSHHIDLRDSYLNFLAQACSSGDSFETTEATAAQRAEAFLRTLGLWKDDACPQSEISTTANL